jgi:hypothetical protein
MSVLGLASKVCLIVVFLAGSLYIRKGVIRHTIYVIRREYSKKKP